jgi:hypothetical protein
MNHPVRAFLFRHYPWFILAVLAIALPAVAYLSKPDNITGNVATVIGGAAGVVFFVQKRTCPAKHVAGCRNAVSPLIRDQRVGRVRAVRRVTGQSGREPDGRGVG